MTSPSVIDIVQARAARRSRVPHGDGHRVALCIEGGAMRGVTSAGMVSALETLGLIDAFDAIYGSSAGALNAAYFLAGQAARGTTIYYEDINTARFIDLRNPLRSRPILDLDFLMGEVLRRRKRLDVDRVLGAPTPLSVLATDVAAAAAARFQNFSGEDDLISAMRASATMPVIAGDPLEYRGGRYFDASLTEPIPLPTAEADGHTHVLVLLTRPDAEPRALSVLDRAFVIPRLRRISPELAARFVDRAEPYATLLRCIDAGSGPLGVASVLGIRPPPPAVSRLERRRARLVAGAEGGYRAVLQAFGRA